MVAAGIATMVQGERTDLPSNDGMSMSREDAAKAMNVGTASADRAKKVLSEADETTIADIKAGKQTVGEALLYAKALCKHGEFKGWVQRNTKVSYSHARKYMQVARQFEQNDYTGSLSDLAGVSIREFLGIKDKPKSPGVTAPVGNQRGS